MINERAKSRRPLHFEGGQVRCDAKVCVSVRDLARLAVAQRSVAGLGSVQYRDTAGQKKGRSADETRKWVLPCCTPEEGSTPGQGCLGLASSGMARISEARPGRPFLI